MKLPKTLRIAHTDIDVVEWNPTEARVSRRWGEWSGVEMKIRVQMQERRFHEVVCTLLHEILHAVFWAYEIRTVENLDKGDHPDTEERLCGILATAMTQVFRDNPELVEFIRGDGEFGSE